MDGQQLPCIQTKQASETPVLTASAEAAGSWPVPQIMVPGAGGGLTGSPPQLAHPAQPMSQAHAHPTLPAAPRLYLSLCLQWLTDS